MKFTAAMAMPTPKSTPARTRFEPPSPNAKVNPDTTIATRERPRAIVLVNAVIKTLTAFSQGELPVACAKAGAARSRPTATARACRETALSRIAFCQMFSCFDISFGHILESPLSGRVLACFLVVSGTPGPKEKNRCPGLPCRAWCQGTLGARAPTRGFQPSRPARRLSAVCDAGRVTLVVRVRPARGGNSSENSPHYREAKKSTNVRDEIEKSFESKIRIFNASLTGSTSPCLCF